MSDKSGWTIDSIQGLAKASSDRVTKRDYKRYACFHAALILESAIASGCVFELYEVGSNGNGTTYPLIPLDPFSDEESEECLKRVTQGVEEIIKELMRRGSSSDSASQILRRTRKELARGKKHE